MKTWVKRIGLAALVGLGLGTGSVYLAPAQVLQADFDRQAWLGGVQKQTLRVADHTWSYYEGGDGPVVVLVHGLSGSKENWLPVLRLLTRKHRVIVIDLPGWGESTRLADTDYGILAQANRLHDFFIAKKLRGVHLVGHSMGGHIAGMFAAEHSDSLSRLTLLDNAGVRFEMNDFARAVLAGKTPFNVNNRAEFDAFMDLMFVHKPFVPGPIKDVWVAQNKRSHAFHIAIVDQLGRGPEQFLLEDQLANIAAPIEAIWCRGDLVLDVSSLDRMKILRPELPTHVMDGCGHMPMMEKPKQLATLLLTEMP